MGKPCIHYVDGNKDLEVVLTEIREDLSNILNMDSTEYWGSNTDVFKKTKTQELTYMHLPQTPHGLVNLIGAGTPNTNVSLKEEDQNDAGNNEEANATETGNAEPDVV